MFMQTFIAEVYAIVRSHVAALSGDGILSFTINDVTLLDSSHKNQVFTLLSYKVHQFLFRSFTFLLHSMAKGRKSLLVELNCQEKLFVAIRITCIISSRISNQVYRELLFQ